MSSPSTHAPIRALLGPTNTGKTHTAIERMLGHSSGMIGLPLRLLAREVYDRICERVGVGRVALITGEEKITPPHAQYWVCTVESMPLDKSVAFVAVDEIQLCNDPERGHVFTHRLLHVRGTSETIFMGSDTITGFVQRLVPDVLIESRPRLSALSYAGHKKISRMPRRSAIVAFSTSDVYAIAELLRRQRGGAAVVLGALSPRTRNAQVALYQAGDVDYLVATDAIGMGLNMDLKHVAFARLRKFDGRKRRALTPAEIGQIAGRAGRFTENGSFGVTADVATMDPDIVERVQSHTFQKLTHLYWRNAKLDFSSIPALIRTLDNTPKDDGLVRTRDAVDYLSLKALSEMPDIQKTAASQPMVELLWDMCGVPDFHKTMTDSHIELLRTMYLQLSHQGKLQEDWLNTQLKRLDRVDGDIDSLTQRLAQIRTWTYVSHRSSWLTDPSYWQERSQDIEARISDALHEGLMKQFVDRRTSVLLNRLQERKVLTGEVTADGEVRVEGELAGHIKGFRFEVADVSADPQTVKRVVSAARGALSDTIEARVETLEKANHDAIILDQDGELFWDGFAIGKILKGESIMDPRIRVYDSDVLDQPQHGRIEKRLSEWMRAEIHAKLKPLFKIERSDLEGAARGVAFQIVEVLGVVPRSTLGDITKSLTPEDRQALKDLGIRLGFKTAFVADVLKPAPAQLRMILWSVFHDKLGAFAAPPAGLMSFPGDETVDEGFYNAAGYRTSGARVVRVDMLERLAFEANKLMEAGPFIAPPEMAATIGCKRDELPTVLEGLGYKYETITNPEDPEAAAQYKFEYAPKRKPARQKGDRKTSKDGAPRGNKHKKQKKSAHAADRSGSQNHKSDKKPKKDKPIDPDSPFAALAKLKIK